MCRIVQDVGILRFCFSHQKYFVTKIFCRNSVGKFRCRIAQVPLYMHTFEFVITAYRLEFVTACSLLNLLLHKEFWICYYTKIFEFVTACILLNLLLHVNFWICYCMQTFEFVTAYRLELVTAFFNFVTACRLLVYCTYVIYYNHKQYH